MNCRASFTGLLVYAFFALTGLAAPVIDPIPNATIPAGKSLTLPITATSSSGRPLSYTITSSTNSFAVVMHTNNPYWQLTVAQAATNTAPGAYQTPYRGGTVTVTNVGTMTFMLFPEYAPHAVNVFQGLTTSGFYNSNTIFHRVVSNFVIQGGDPKTNGTGGLIFNYDDEFNPQALFTGNGQLALANSGKDSGNCQFFVTVGPQRELDFSYTVFGQLVRGFGVLTNISKTLVDTNSRPLADEIIQLASYVTNTTDTVLTLTATNIAGKTGKITVIADDGTGGRATNTFSATSVTDTNSNYNAFLFPNTVTNLVAPKNTTLTNFLNALELDGDPLYWFYFYISPTNNYNLSGNVSNRVFRTLTYNQTNSDGQLQIFVQPANNFSGVVSFYFDVSYLYDWNYYYITGVSPLPAYDEQVYTFVFGDTPIGGQTNSITVLVAAPFTNALMATFTNGVPGSAATNFTATINWGDNTITSGTITTNASGQKNVWGAHKYLYPGTYPVYVSVQSTIGASANFLSYVNAITSRPKLTLTAAPPLNASGFTFNLQLPGAVNGSIQFSTNLTSWLTLTNFIGTNTTLTFHDQAATNSPHRYYRALVP